MSDDQPARFRASGWNTLTVDGQDPEAVADALAKARADSSKPWLIACKTTIGYGAPTKAGKASTHGEPLGEEEIKGAREKLHWPYPPFEVPEPVLAAWRAVGERGAKERTAWKARVAGNAAAAAALAQPAGAAEMPAVAEAIAAAKSVFAGDEQKRATRVWSQMTIERVLPVLPELIGGSADFTGSNGTRTKLHTAISKGDFSGNYIHYGVREHAMGAVMNGIALNGGFIPYGGTFLVFTDYCRAAIRLSALMRQRVIYVMTHDSIGLGEDGPTHQPIEHLAALRAVPHLIVMRPADGVETAECWEIALEHAQNPSILALSRQAVPNVRRAPTAENMSAKGAYVLSEPEGGRDVTLIATGSEVGIAVDAADALADDGVRAAVVSMPSMELFRAQDAAYRALCAGQRAARCHRGGRGAVLVRMAWRGRALRRPLRFRRLGARAEALMSTSASPQRTSSRPCAVF